MGIFWKFLGFMASLVIFSVLRVFWSLFRFRVGILVNFSGFFYSIFGDFWGYFGHFRDFVGIFLILEILRYFGHFSGF